MGEDTKKKPIIGGIFGTQTEIDAEGNITQKDDFHLRLYWEVFEPEVQKALKGNAFKVFLFIAMHLDKNGEGWPSQRRIAEKLQINKDTVGTAVARLEKFGLIEASQDRKPDGTWANTVYKLRFTPDIVDEETEKTVSEKTGHGEKPHEIKDSTVSEKIGDGKTGSGKPGHKEEPSPKKDIKDDSIKTIDKDDQRAREEKESTPAISLDDLDLSYLPDTYPTEIREVVEKRPELFPNVRQALKITERIRWAHGKAAKKIGYEIPQDYKLSAQVLREVIVRYALGKIQKDWIGYYHNALTDRLFAKALEREAQAEREQQVSEFSRFDWVNKK